MATGQAFWDKLARGEVKTLNINTSMRPFMSPIDGKMIHSSKDLREHNARHNVVQTGDEYEKKRDDYIAKTNEENKIDKSIIETGKDYINQVQQEITNG